MVSKAREDLPEPDRPVKTTSLSRGMVRSTFLRLCSRAPRMTIARPSNACADPAAAGVEVWADPRFAAGSNLTSAAALSSGLCETRRAFGAADGFGVFIDPSEFE